MRPDKPEIKDINVFMNDMDRKLDQIIRRFQEKLDQLVLTQRKDKRKK